ncbi:MAG: hypothetical protein F4029_17435 [Gammaproteobacteria bacterium]|nr:hypothetical protein [Gammaproteobacteria bacterium]MYK48002.1 hypothetical protein [Gammaproteobacteria bacterium]
MGSTLAWLDYSERDRRRALEVIDLFRETGTVDELGLAGVRDSYSDLFFPGTSTIQTRACYFLLVPWTFLRLERLGKRSNEAAAWTRREELRLNRRLRTGDDTAGVFGIQAGDALKRLPSEVYWGGLGSWGIRTFSGHMWAYFRSLDSFYSRRHQLRDTPHDPEGKRALPANWHPHIPSPPSGFPYKSVSVALRPQDAAYLRDRIQARHAESLLAVLASRAVRADLAADRPWRHSALAEVSPTLREHLRDARLFAICMQGAALLYNLMLSEKQGHGGRMETYHAELADWVAEVQGLRSDLADWQLDGVWSVVRAKGRSLGYPTQSFVTRWIDDLKRDGPEALVRQHSAARALVREREVQLKRGRARLTNARHLELWGGRSGTGRMAYRWGATKVLLKDIIDGLERSEGDAGNA